MGQGLIFLSSPAVPPILSVCSETKHIDHSFMYYHTCPPDNGSGHPSASTFPDNMNTEFQAALTSPFNKNSCCRNLTACGSLETNILTYFSRSSVSIINLLLSICSVIQIVKNFFISHRHAAISAEVSE